MSASDFVLGTHVFVAAIGCFNLSQELSSFETSLIVKFTFESFYRFVNNTT